MSRTSRTAIPLSLAALIGLALAIGTLLQRHSPGAVSAAQDAPIARGEVVFEFTKPLDVGV